MVLQHYLLGISYSKELDVLDSLTGNIELGGPLHSHTSYRESHQTGEVGAMVLGSGLEGQH